MNRARPMNGTARPALRPSLGGWLAPSYTGSSATLSLAEQIADDIATHIIHGTYAPGERLQELALAATYEVSRGPVRDALKLLDREGLVVLLARRGASVRKLSRADVEDIFEVRAALYGLAAEAMARRAEPDVLGPLKASVGELRDALAIDDAERFLDALYAKSMFVADGCGNDLLRSLIYMRGRQTLSLTQRAMLVGANRERWVANWRAMVKAIVAGDAVAADAAGRKLVRDVHAMVMMGFVDTDSGDEASQRIERARPHEETT